jgi:hypothetical protein
MSVERYDSSRRTQFAAAILVSPLILAPSVTIVSMLWARYESILIHPAAAGRNPPTVSRAIADHSIGDPFAQWMLGVCTLQAFAVWRIVQAFYRTAIVPARTPARARLFALLGSAVLCQAGAIIGLLVLSHYDSTNYSEIHQWGSYLLFYGNGISIALAGVFVWLAERWRDPQAKRSLAPLPYDYYLQTRLAAVVAAIGFVFGGLFYATVPLERWHDYDFRVTFAMTELVLLTACVIYLASFVVPMYRYERYRLRGRGMERDAA